MKECPVCQRPDLADGLLHCPQCNADLECFELLDSLHEKPAGQVPAPSTPETTEERSGDTGSRTGDSRRGGSGSEIEAGAGTGRRRLGLVVWPVVGLLLVLVPLLVFVGSRYLDDLIGRRLEQPLASAGGSTASPPPDWQRLYAAVQTLSTRLDGMEQQFSGLAAQQAAIDAETERQRQTLRDELSRAGERMSGVEGQLVALGQRSNEPAAAAKPEPPVNFVEYDAAPADTLWWISRHFYGNGIYYPVILEDNPGLTIHGRSEPRTIRIAWQREHAQETYRRLAFVEGGQTLFRYRARVGESWRSLSRAFYGSSRRERELAELNGSPHPAEGERVLIPLE